MRRQLAELSWVVGGQAATALGTLVGVRVLTQFLKPASYGVLSLSLGLSVLAVGLIATPPTQAAIHYYPTLAAEGAIGELLRSLLRCLRRAAPWAITATIVGGAAYVEWANGSVVLVVLTTLLLASDCWRTANLSLLNAARRQRRYALWAAADAWGRPLAGTAVAVTVGQSPEAVLAAYVVVSIVLQRVFSHRLWSAESHSTAQYSGERRRVLDARMWSYALPLVPLGIIAWASSLGDRYIIGGFLSAADAGLYVAVYGLASIPFMIVNGTVEQALRPLYQVAVSAGNQPQARKILTLWLLVVIASCLLGVLVFACGNRILAGIFLGQSYRQAAPLMPWIALGYAIRASSYVFERICYAYGRTHRVLITQLCAVLVAAIATPLGVLTGGVKGAALAVPIYFSVQLAVAVILAERTLREARQSGAAASLGRIITAGP